MARAKQKVRERFGLSTEGNTNTTGYLNGARIRELRKKRGLRQEDVSRETGISLQTISRLERKSAVAGTNKLVKLANFFGVPYGYLLGEEAPRLSEYVAGRETRSGVEKLLSMLSGSRHKPAKMLEAFCAFLDADPQNLARSSGTMEEEEEILGLWWSIMSAYERGSWEYMISKAEALLRLGERLGCLHLVALARAYKAKAIRNTGTSTSLKEARQELEMIPKESDGFESALIDRLSAKVLAREGKLKEALAKCKRAEELMKKSSREDVLFLLEKTKLMRNIAVLNGRLARKDEADKDRAAKPIHIKEAEKYLDRCQDAIDNLSKYLKRGAKVERMLLAFAKARHFEIQSELEKALKSAKMALQFSEKLGEPGYGVRVKMFLVHVCMQLGYKEEAARYYGSLLPLRKYRTGWFEHHYTRWLEPYEKRISEYAAR